MQQHSYLGIDSKGFHKIVYQEWGKPNELPILCVHGLSRNGRDFDYLAKKLIVLNHHVVCPDVVGRGDSDHLLNPADYGFPLYMNDLTALIARLNVSRVGFIGTSMGGILGMWMAALMQTPIQYLVMNDVGAFIPAAAIQRIKNVMDAYSQSTLFANYQDAENYMRNTTKHWGELSNEHYQHITQYSIKQTRDLQYTLKLDPMIHLYTKDQPAVDVNLWPLWSMAKCPVLLIRGANSDLFTKDTAQQMQNTHPNCTLVEIPNTGHAPALMSDEQIKIITDWIMKLDIH